MKAQISQTTARWFFKKVIRHPNEVEIVIEKLGKKVRDTLTVQK